MLSLIPRLPVGHIRSRSLAKMRTALSFTPSALSEAVEAMDSNTFASFTGTIPARANHPTSGYSVNVFEDGKAAAAAQCFGYSGKGCYDPTTRRVLWMCGGASYSGINNYDSGTYVYNTRPIYTESTDAWTCDRSFKASDEGTGVACVSHQYDSNCIDVNGRKLYKWAGFGGGIYAYDLDDGTMGEKIAGPSGLNTVKTADWAMEFVPTRGDQGAIWLLAHESGSNGDMAIWEYTLHNATWAQIFSPIASVFSDPEYEPLMSYNPRAFSGAGAVMICGAVGIRIIRCSDLDITNPGLGAAGTPRFNGFCRDPVGDGWLHMYQGTDRVWRYSSGSGWENRAALDGLLTSGDFMTVPIDLLGVVFSVAYNGGTPAGRLYKP